MPFAAETCRETRRVDGAGCGACEIDIQVSVQPADAGKAVTAIMKIAFMSAPTQKQIEIKRQLIPRDVRRSIGGAVRIGGQDNYRGSVVQAQHPRRRAANAYNPLEAFVSVKRRLRRASILDSPGGRAQKLVRSQWRDASHVYRPVLA